MKGRSLHKMTMTVSSCVLIFIFNFLRELNNQIMESEACHSLGVAHHALGDYAAAVRHHRAELELAHRLGLTHLQVIKAFERTQSIQ